MELVADLRDAAQAGQITTAYQPQVDLGTLEFVAVESLARWAHPSYGLIPPGIFIPLAEAHGLIDDISQVIIDDGIRQLVKWNALGLELELAINISAVQLKDPKILDQLQRSLKDSRLSPSQIVVEITESLPIADSREGLARLTVFRDDGLGVSVDDVGTGYSALAQSSGVPATEIKIDKSLIQDPDAALAVLSGLVETAHSQGLRIVAEGIETQHQLAMARRIGCDRGQGYLFGRPMTAEVLTTVLTGSTFESAVDRARRITG